MDGVTVVTMNLPHGQKGLWFRDLNVVGLAPGLDEAAREQALAELYEQWREVIEAPVTAAA
jgi:hypothetical protein